MMAPKVSVCIDVCNYAAFLPEAVESVLNQDFTDFELIIVDDASTDGSFEMAQSYAAKDSRVIAKQNPTNLGMIKNRNACLRLAQGEYVKILHADDFLNHTHALHAMASALDANPGMSLVASAMQIVRNGFPQDERFAYFDEEKPYTGTSVITRCLRENRNLMGPPTATMFRRSRSQRGFDESFFNSADWEMWFHLLEQGCFGFLDEPLVSYRKHESQQTEKDKQTLTESEDRLALLARYLDKPYVRLSRLCKRHLRHQALANYSKCSQRLGSGNGKALIHQHGALQFYGFSPISRVYGQLLRQSRFLKRTLGPRNRRAVKSTSPFPPGLNVAGFFQGEYGVGDSSRAICDLIQKSSLPAAFINISSRNHRNLDRSIQQFSETNPYSVNLMTFSFDYARRFSRDQGHKYFRNRTNIGLWFWELELFPPRWHSCFDYYDEIWTCTSFCQKALAAVSPIPVVPIGYPLADLSQPKPDRQGFGVSPEDFVFVFNFDFHSVVERKNPEGLIRAFRTAFGANRENAVLILKSINSHHYPERLALLKKQAAGLKILWLNEHLDGARMLQLFSTADCYVSLHRSEGLGLGMARAMSFGKPVIATGYSGNLDFTKPESSLLVRYELAEILQDHGVYEKGNVWAEPDSEHAAHLMRWVYENPDKARELGLRAQAGLRLVMDPESVLTKVRQRLKIIDTRFEFL